MVFKELEIQGFKSFPDKVKITFDEGVTGVVGPTSCAPPERWRMSSLAAPGGGGPWALLRCA